jgi:hypothetical protein
MNQYEPEAFVSFGGSRLRNLRELNVKTHRSETLSADKYAVTVIKTREVLDINEDYRKTREPDSHTKLMSSIDRLLGFLISQYHTPVSLEDVRKVMNVSEINILNDADLSNLSDGLVPVVIFRELLKNRQLVLDPRAVPNWKKFSERYMSLVLHA